MERTSSLKNSDSNAGNAAEYNRLNSILHNWFATLFAYQPEIYFELDQFRRDYNNAQGMSASELQFFLIESGLLSVTRDEKVEQKFYLKLDTHLFGKAHGKVWAVTILKNGGELEFTCFDDDAAPASSRHFQERTLH